MKKPCLLPLWCSWRGKKVIPVCRYTASLQSCSVDVGPLLDVFGHLLCPLNDLDVGRCQQDDVLVSKAERGRSNTSLYIWNGSIACIQTLPQAGGAGDIYWWNPFSDLSAEQWLKSPRINLGESGISVPACSVVFMWCMVVEAFARGVNVNQDVNKLWELCGKVESAEGDGQALGVSAALLLSVDDRWAPVCVCIETHNATILFHGKLHVSVKPYEGSKTSMCSMSSLSVFFNHQLQDWRRSMWLVLAHLLARIPAGGALCLSLPLKSGPFFFPLMVALFLL